MGCHRGSLLDLVSFSIFIHALEEGVNSTLKCTDDTKLEGFVNSTEDMKTISWDLREIGNMGNI